MATSSCKFQEPLTINPKPIGKSCMRPGTYQHALVQLSAVADTGFHIGGFYYKIVHKAHEIFTSHTHSN